ncbi:MAG: hypothetical protein H7288_05545 [Kineosporiaceae bacterium]|nr:hypothetical protein [Aeromicrobium sp.]
MKPLIRSIQSEAIKLISTRLLAICLLSALLLSVGATSLLAATVAQQVNYCNASDCSNGPIPVILPMVTMGFLGDGTLGVGLTALMILSAMVLLVEYSHSTIQMTFIATPRRSTVLIGKAVVGFAITAVSAAVCLVTSALAFRLVAGEAARDLEIFGQPAWSLYVTGALTAGVAAVFALGIAALFRNVAAAIAIVVLWPSVVELMLPQLFGERAADAAVFLPFLNARNFMGLDAGVDFHWSPAGSGLYFLVFAVVIFVAGVLMSRRADNY